MKYLTLITALLLSACDNTSPAPKIAEPQRDVLEKAKGVEQAVQQNTDETKQKVEDETQ